MVLAIDRRILKSGERHKNPWVRDKVNFSRRDLSEYEKRYKDRRKKTFISIGKKDLVSALILLR